jgi:hypothetical protein
MAISDVDRNFLFCYGFCFLVDSHLGGDQRNDIVSRYGLDSISMVERCNKRS